MTLDRRRLILAFAAASLSGGAQAQTELSAADKALVGRAVAYLEGLDEAKGRFLQTYLVNNARQLGMAGRILFPIPERGLHQRMYRIKARTVIIWGDSDRLIPPVYAHGFKKGIAGAGLISIPEAGHMVTLEQPKAVAEAIRGLG